MKAKLIAHVAISFELELLMDMFVLYNIKYTRKFSYKILLYNNNKKKSIHCLNITLEEAKIAI